ncbi:Ribonuclease P protein subunit P38-like protein [Parasponia andersonii]|uniref:Ribonuclease P protein subunit P38-like protein n=1 Tax=Parasponia andersonii TaxID=3476 RepID=A0A2P5DFG8_PARAD|nr:Ribonuclease P protein subunit P38-like protein [Parasponia andersonii]
MEEKVVPSSNSFSPEDKSDSLYPMYFGVSCAFFAVRLLSLPHDMEDERWCDIREKMLQGIAQLLGLLVWRVQREGGDGEKSSEILLKLKNAERDIAELKRIRHEDAKANEKVVSIFAAQEQSWLIERKKLRQHIGALMSELRFLEKKKDQAVSEMNDKLNEMENLVQTKDKALEEEGEKRKEIEEKLEETENLAEELREKAKRESQEHSSELRKHKTAFIELVSNQRHLEADMSRAIRQVEAKKRELDSVLKQKEESVLMVQKLSAEVLKMHKDLEQKDKILSATLRKSKIDTAEKQMLLKEVKLSKAKRKQAELETERWKAVSETRQERHSLRNMLAKQGNSRLETVSGERGLHSSSLSHIGHNKSNPSDALLEFEHSEFRNESEGFSPPFDSYSLRTNEDADAKQIESWVRSEAERYAAVIEQRHHLEIDAFVEQLRLKDEKLEAFRWRMLSMELESKRLQSHVEGLNKELLQLRHNNIKMEALLLEREEELTSLKEQFVAQIRSLNFQKNNFNSSSHDSAEAHDDASWSQIKAVKRQPIEPEEQETKTISVEMSQEEGEGRDNEVLSGNQSRNTNVILTVQSPDKEFDEQKDCVSHGGSSEKGSSSPVEIDSAEKLPSPIQQQLSKTNSSEWRMDLHALGVSYKLKRLKQQLIMLERLRGNQESSGDNKETNDDGETGVKDFVSLMSLLNKQVGRYQSLQSKVDDLCKRMHESDLELSRRDSNTARTKEKTKKLEHFLEETFQLQRYIVATGQKVMEIQSKITSGLVGAAEELEKPTGGFNMNRFADSVRTLFHDVQRGLEVRIARVIGDLEGTLACEGMIRLRR